VKKLLAVLLTTCLVGEAMAQSQPAAEAAPMVTGATEASDAAVGSLVPVSIGAGVVVASMIAGASGNSSNHRGNDNTPPGGGGGGTGGTTGTTGTTGTH
jgi:hypothetical protein